MGGDPVPLAHEVAAVLPEGPLDVDASDDASEQLVAAGMAAMAETPAP